MCPPCGQHAQARPCTAAPRSEGGFLCGPRLPAGVRDLTSDNKVTVKAAVRAGLKEEPPTQKPLSSGAFHGDDVSLTGDLGAPVASPPVLLEALWPQLRFLGSNLTNVLATH